MSKFRLDEFIPYARYFYGEWPEYDIAVRRCDWYPYKYTKEGIQEAFDLAWLKHQHRNPHHWQHWLLQEDNGDLKTIGMPDKYIKEMVADWKGAGRAITGKNDPEECKSWYLKNYKKIKLTNLSRIKVDNILNIWEDVVWKEIHNKINISRAEAIQISNKILEKAEEERKL